MDILEKNIQTNIFDINKIVINLQKACLKPNFYAMSNLTKELKKKIRKTRNIIYQVIHKEEYLLTDILSNMKSYTIYIISIIETVCNKKFCATEPTEYAYSEICENIMETMTILRNNVEFLLKLTEIPLGKSRSSIKPTKKKNNKKPR